MGRAGYDTTDPSAERSSAAYNAVAMHRAQKLLEQEAAEDREAEAALAKAVRSKRGVAALVAEQREAKKARLEASAAPEKEAAGK